MTPEYKIPTLLLELSSSEDWGGGLGKWRWGAGDRARRGTASDPERPGRAATEGSPIMAPQYATHILAQIKIICPNPDRYLVIDTWGSAKSRVSLIGFM